MILSVLHFILFFIFLVSSLFITLSLFRRGVGDFLENRTGGHFVSYSL